MADLTTLTNLKQYLKVTDSGSDSLLARLVSAASQYFLTQVNRGSFLVDSYTEQRAGHGTSSMLLLHYPVQSVVELTINNEAIPASPDGVQPGYVFDDYGIDLIGYRFHRGKGNISVTYTAGYPNQVVSNEAQTVPSASPYQITVDQAGSFEGSANASYLASGLPLTSVTGVPTVGEFVEAANGVLTFAAADGGKQLLIGYEVSGVPGDVEQAVIELAALKYRSKNWIGERSQSQAGQITVSYSNADVERSVREVIDLYKRSTLIPL